MKFKKDILLTGAGFTANFGGLLAREVWSKMLNNPKIDTIPVVKERLKEAFDFESIYANVRGQDRDVLLEIIIESFTSMDDALKNNHIGGYRQSGIDVREVSKLLGSFAGRGGETGFHFTLNQDLFLERQVHIVPLGLPMYQYRDYGQSIQSSQIDARQHVTLPDETFIAGFKEKHLSSVGDLCYIKLHGSLGWLSHDGSQQMILGTNKLEDLKNSPLLNWYFELFQEAISQPGARLFVVGYSFRDKHINDCLTKAIDANGLKIYIISPEDPELFKDRMSGNPYPGQPGISHEVSNDGAKIWKAVAGYFPYRLKDLYPAQSETHLAQDLKKILS